jgi:hypothetical protein
VCLLEYSFHSIRVRAARSAPTHPGAAFASALKVEHYRELSKFYNKRDKGKFDNLKKLFLLTWL